jgi:hypothetical protein
VGTPPLIELINAGFGDGYIIASAKHPEARRLRSAPSKE